MFWVQEKKNTLFKYFNIIFSKLSYATIVSTHTVALSVAIKFYILHRIQITKNNSKVHIHIQTLYIYNQVL